MKTLITLLIIMLSIGTLSIIENPDGSLSQDELSITTSPESNNSIYRISNDGLEKGINFMSSQSGDFTITTSQYLLNDYYAAIDGWVTPMIWFNTLELGSKSYITITSDLDGETQTITPENLHQWQTNKSQAWINHIAPNTPWDAYSALFNGPSLTVTFYKHQNDASAGYTIKELFPMGKGECDVQDLLGEENCLSSVEPPAVDTRIASTNAAVGRLFCHNYKGKGSGGTGWIIRNGLILGPGHGLGKNLRWCLLVMNMLPNDPDGKPHAPPISDQYTMDIPNIEYQNSGIGRDWGVAKPYPNIVSGLFPGQSQSAFLRITDQIPNLPFNDANVTGFGADITPRGSLGCFNEGNKTQQIRPINILSQYNSSSKNYIRLQGVVTGGDSGSLVILNSTGEAIAIQTHGCSTDYGTTFKNQLLISAIENYLGSTTKYVDSNHPNSNESGEFFDPYSTIVDGISGATNGDQLSITEGYYNETITVTKSLTLTAPVGKVTIGAGGPAPKSIGIVADSETTGEEETDEPVKLELTQNYPNPFNPSTTISYSVPEDAHASITVYNTAGQEVALLTDKFHTSGEYSVLFNASRLSSGVYFYVLRYNGKELLKRMTLIK